MEKFYLGPKWFPPWLRKRLPFAREFSAPARCHDFLYGIGGNEHRRRKADTLFFRLMLAKLITLPIMKAVWGTICAVIYYVLVRIFGPISFVYYFANL